MPLAVLLPYNDGDVSDLEGVHFFDDSLHNVPGDTAPKDLIVAMGADHNFYNTVWTPGLFPYVGAPAYFGGTSDDGFPGPPTRLTPAQEEGTGLASVSAFFRTYLGHETAFGAFLRGDAPPPASAQVTAAQLIVSYQAPDNPLVRRDLNTLLTPTNLTTDSLGGAVITSGLATYTVFGGAAPELPVVFPFDTSLSYPDLGISYVARTKPGLSQLDLGYQGTLSAVYENDLPLGTAR